MSLTTSVQLSTQRIASGLDDPLYVTTPSGDSDRLFILEQKTGAIKIFDLASQAVLPTPFLTIPTNELLNDGFEQGLLGLAFAPDYNTSGKFYVSYTAPGGGNAGQTKVVEYQVSPQTPNLADPTTARTVLTIAQPQENHNGGWLAFGPDNYLYWASGDGGGSGFRPGIPDESDNSQDITDNLLGKILRLDVSRDAFPDDPNRNYAIPADNPFVGQPGDDEIWAYGLRNPWRPSFDRLTGDLYIADVGQSRREELNFQPANRAGGVNYGWNLYEGTLLYKPGTIPPNVTFPIVEYNHSVGRSITGGYVYRGAVAELSGTYFFGDFSTGRIWSFRYDGATLRELTERTEELQPIGGGVINNIASFGEDANGNLYIVDIDGEIFRLNVERTTTFDASDILSFSQYARFQQLDEGITLNVPQAERGGISLTRLFDETFYRAKNPDVAEAISAGRLDSGVEHFIRYGVSEGRDPSILFNEEFYLATNFDVAIAVLNNVHQSGLEHYLEYGAAEGRDPSRVFDESDYLLTNSDVQAGINSGAHINGFDHYLDYGAMEGRLPGLFLFQEAFYLDANPDVALAVSQGVHASGFDHYIRYGQKEARDPSVLFDESAYLNANGDVAIAVLAGIHSSGFEHYLNHGRAEGRDAIALV